MRNRAPDPPTAHDLPYAELNLLRGLPTADLDRLVALLRQRRVPAGTVLLTAEQPGEAIYLIRRGSVRVFLDEPGGTQVTLAFLGPGDSLGEMSLVDRSGRSANAETREETVLAWLDRGSFEEALRVCPQLTENLVRELAARLRAANQLIRALTTLDVTGRVSRQILALSDQYGRPTTAGAIRIPFVLHQRELAELVGATRERVNRVLRELREQGAIEIDGGHIEVTARPVLERHTHR
jgi:CRP/FNR family cyclic AMP-dependent transcriptional regulator